MINQSTTSELTRGVNGVSKIVPVVSVERIASAAQEFASKAKNFNIGQVYLARVLENLPDKTQLVEVGDTILKMQLGDAGKAGQTIPLKFLQLQPIPTFLLESAGADQAPETHLSTAAKLIGSLLQEAKLQGATPRHQAEGIVTQQPNNPQQIAQDLKQALSKTGLFYESHLTALAQGERNLESIKQEPQNLNKMPLATLVSQQLNMLETNKLSWNGQIWPGQEMALDLFVLPENQVEKDARRKQQSVVAEDRPIQTNLVLDLPTLGKVKAEISLVNGKLSVQLSAKQQNTAKTLAQQKFKLIDTLNANGQTQAHVTVSALNENMTSFNHGLIDASAT
jgi:hypothetical protein